MKSRVNVITSLLILAAFLTIADTNIASANYINVDITEVSPDKISHQDDLPDTTITLEFELPEDSILEKDNFKVTSLMIYAKNDDIEEDIEIEAILQGATFDESEEENVNETDGTTTTTTKTTVTIIATFDTDKLMVEFKEMDELPEDYDHTFLLDVEGKLESGEGLLGYEVGVITIVEAKNYISKINLDQIWDYGDPTDTADTMYEFRLEICADDFYYDYDGNSDIYRAEIMNTDINSVDILTPAGQTFTIPKEDGEWSNDNIWKSYESNVDPDIVLPEWESRFEYKARFEDSADLLQAYSDGEYTITLHLSDGIYVQTTAFFGNPYTEQPIPQPTHEPVLTSELQQQTLGSLVTFEWEPCEDSSVDEIYINMLSTFNNEVGNKDPNFTLNEISWGPVLLLEGSWQAELIFSTFTTTPDLHWQNENDDDIDVGVAKSSRCRYRITIEDAPWNIYEVWGGKVKLSSKNYLYFEELEAYDYKNIGQSDGSETFLDKNEKFNCYLIATMGQCFIESIQGSDKSFNDSFEHIHNIYNENNLCVEQDEQCAILGSGKARNDYSYNGYFAFTNPNDWENVTVSTSNRNLHLDKSLDSVTDEELNIKDINDIDPNDIITYSITFDTYDFPLDVKEEEVDVKDEKDENNATPNKVHNIKVVDILSEHVIFEGAFPPVSNEVTESYDPIAHTYTRQYPNVTVDHETPIGHRLIVRVDPNTLPGTTITNYATIDSDETPPSIARSMDLLIPYAPLNITTRTINSDGNDIDWIESGKSFIYEICFDNNNNGPHVEDVNLVIDSLPDEVAYVGYQSDNGNFFGFYDDIAHSFKGTMDTLEPGKETRVYITVDTVEVYENTLSTTIYNTVTINSNETPDANDVVGIEVIPPLEVEDVIITPDILNRDGTPQYITAVVMFPTGIQQRDIDPVDIPKLYYQDRDSGEFKLIGYGSRPVLSGTQITTLFNRAELMDAIYGYGEFTLKVEGQLKSSLTFYGYDTILITKFTGN